MNQAQSILVRNGLVRIPTDNSGNQLIDEAGLATLMANLTHFGFALTEEGLGALNCLGAAAATTWWQGRGSFVEKTPSLREHRLGCQGRSAIFVPGLAACKLFQKMLAVSQTVANWCTFMNRFVGALLRYVGQAVE